MTISESDSPDRSARVNNPPDMGCVRERLDEAVILTSHWSVPATVVRENQRTERAVMQLSVILTCSGSDITTDS